MTMDASFTLWNRNRLNNLFLKISADFSRSHCLLWSLSIMLWMAALYRRCHGYPELLFSSQKSVEDKCYPRCGQELFCNIIYDTSLLSSRNLCTWSATIWLGITRCAETENIINSNIHQKSLYVHWKRKSSNAIWYSYSLSLLDSIIDWSESRAARSLNGFPERSGLACFKRRSLSSSPASYHSLSGTKKLMTSS